MIDKESNLVKKQTIIIENINIEIKSSKSVKDFFIILF